MATETVFAENRQDLIVEFVDLSSIRADRGIKSPFNFGRNESVDRVFGGLIPDGRDGRRRMLSYPGLCLGVATLPEFVL